MLKRKYLMNTLDVLREIITNNKEIESYLFYYFPKQKLLQDEITFNKIEDIQFNEAIAIRNKYNLPFWDSIMLTYFNREETSDKILKCALRHNELKDGLWTNNIDSIFNKLISDNNINIAFNSKVKLKSRVYKHIPLLDFHIPISKTNQSIVNKVIRLLGFSKGYILESGESYHFIGTELLDDNELISFLSKALLFAPIIDRAWIAHQLLEKASSLRISYKHNTLPKLIHKI